MPSATLADAGRHLLAYQPFRLNHSLLTGIGYSWLFEHEPCEAKLVFDFNRDGFDLWSKGMLAFSRLERCYQALLDVIVETCPGGSYLDLPCNTGWFPIAASLRGMTPSVGCDNEDYGPAMTYLKAFTGSPAEFIQVRYLPDLHRFDPPAVGKRYDIVSSMNFMCHLPDPAHFLAALADLAGHAVLLWSAFLRSDERLIRYGGADTFFGGRFPYCYDAGTAISDTLLIDGMQRLGFPNCTEVTERDGMWPAEWDNPRMKPFQPMRAFLFTRS